jgi:MYXO-CTERM domain-containing protein
VAGLVEEGESRVSLEPSPQLGLFDPSRQAEPVVTSEEEMPAFMEADPPTRPSWAWALLALLALAGLIGQTAYRYRAEVLTYLPEARPLLEMGCEQLGCQVLPRRLLLMSIDGDELRVDPARDGIILLTATIRNTAPFPQQYPSLQLFLEDESGRPVAGRVLSPRDYLDGGRSPAQVATGIAARAEAPVRVHLASQDLPATRYRLVLFYPS